MNIFQKMLSVFKKKEVAQTDNGRVFISEMSIGSTTLSDYFDVEIDEQPPYLSVIKSGRGVNNKTDVVRYKGKTNTGVDHFHCSGFSAKSVPDLIASLHRAYGLDVDIKLHTALSGHIGKIVRTLWIYVTKDGQDVAIIRLFKSHRDSN